MHFFKTKTKLPRRVTLVAVAFLSSALCITSQVSQNTNPSWSQVVYARKTNPKNNKHPNKTPKKPKKVVTKEKIHPLGKSSFKGTTPRVMKPFKFVSGGSKNLGSGYGNTYFVFHKIDKAIPEGGHAKDWSYIPYGDGGKGHRFKYDLWSIAKQSGHKGFSSSNLLIKNPADRPAVLYPKIATMHTQSSDKGFVKKSQLVDIRVTLVGFADAYGFSDPNHVAIYFKPSKIQISHKTGLNAKMIYAVQIYKSGTNQLIGKLHETPMSFWDIDGGQGVGVSDFTGVPRYRVTGTKGTHGIPYLHSGPSGRAREMLFGDNQNHVHPADSREGTVRGTDPNGSITYILGESIPGQFLVSFTAAQSNTYMSSVPRLKLSPNSASSKKLSSYTKRNPRKGPHELSPGNMFAMDSNINAAPPGPKFLHDKWVKKSEPTKPKGWVHNLDELKYDVKNPSKTSYYYRFTVSNAFPKALKQCQIPHTKKYATIVLNKLGASDNHISAGLDYDTTWTKGLTKSNPVAFYYQDYDKAPLKKVKQSKVNALFKITQSSTGTYKNLSIKLRNPINSEQWADPKYSWLFSRNLSMIFKVKGNKKLIRSFKPAGKNVYKATLKNAASIYNEIPLPTPDTIVKITTDKKTPDEEAMVNPIKGHKEVYRLNDGKVGNDKVVNDDDWSWESYDKGTVLPGQYLTYTLHFELKKPVNSKDQYVRYTQLHLTDNIDDHIDHINNMYMGDKKLSKQFKVPLDDPKTRKIDLKLKEDKYEELFKKFDQKGGELWFRYQAKLKSKQPTSDNEKVYNQAQLEPTTKAVKRVHVTVQTKTEDSSLNKDGHSHTITKTTNNVVLHVINNPKVSEELNKWFGDGAGNDTELKEALKNGGKIVGSVQQAEWGNMKAPKIPTAKTNKVENPLIKQGPPPIGQKKYTDKVPHSETVLFGSKAGDKESNSDSDFDDSSITRGTTSEFTIKWNPGTINVTMGDIPNSMKLGDKVDSNFFDVVDFKVTDPDGKDITDMATFKSSPTDNDVRWQINDKEKLKKLKFTSEDDTYVMHILVKSKVNKKVTKTEFHNKATYKTEQGYPINQTSNDLTLTPEKYDPSLQKSIKSITDETTGKDWDVGEPLKPNHKYKIHYTVDVSLGNSHSLSNFTLTDSMPEHTQIVGNIGVSTDKGDSYDDITTSDNSLVNDLDISKYSYGNENGFIINGGGSKFYHTNLHVEYDAEVMPEADWSDYYNSYVSTQAGKVQGRITYNNERKNITTDASSLEIPNIVTFTAGDYTASATASFQMRAQTFKAEQYIVQDNDVWGFNLDPSHYLPHTRNDKSAITTAVRVRMPNYFKIDQVKFMNEAKSAGFDKGQTHVLRVDRKSTDAPWGDPTKLDISL